MTLTLHIENETSLPDGGALSVTIKGKRGLDIGRDPYLDWTLPDPTRFISGRHCEVRWHDGSYWLHDISTNGTFMNGSDSRLKAPHRLRNGDRFIIGQYIIAATLEEGSAALSEQVSEAAESASYETVAEENLWDAVPAAAPPIDPKQLKSPRDLAPARPDFLDWAADVPVPIPQPVSPPMVSAAPVRSEPVALDLGPDDWATEPVVQPSPVASPEAKRPPEIAELGAPESTPNSPEPVDRGAMATFAQLVARGANLPEDAFAGRDASELAEQLGRVLKLATDNMKQLLEARQQAKRLVRSSSQTVIQAVDNNPLKFAPTAEDALRIMFGPKSRGYLDAENAFLRGFDDLKKHQIKTYSAMQQALAMLVKDIDPATIEATSQSDRGVAAILGSRKARLWDIYVARWQAHAKRGILDTFMAYFARCYEDD